MNLPTIAADAPPQSLTNLAASLASSQGIALEVRPTHSMKTLDENGAIAWKADGGTRISIKVVDGADHRAALQSTLEMLRSSLSPPSPRIVEDWLAELDAITAKRASDATDLALRLRAYRDRLCEYPAQAVRYTLLVQRWKFWPTWEELGESLDTQISEVNQMIREIERKLAPASNLQPPPKPKRRMTFEKSSEIVKEIRSR